MDPTDKTPNEEDYDGMLSEDPVVKKLTEESFHDGQFHGIVERYTFLFVYVECMLVSDSWGCPIDIPFTS